WDEEDGFFYDALRLADESLRPLKVRSIVGLIPLFAAQTLESDIVEQLPGFKRRMQWFIDNRPAFRGHVELASSDDPAPRRLLSLVRRDQLVRVLRTMLHETEFLSPYGIRALSRVHRDHPFTLRLDGVEHRVTYEPGESVSGIFGGNSNWRGPIWFPVNYLLIEALQRFAHLFCDGLQVECPTGSGRLLRLSAVARELSQRLTRIFLRDGEGRRPVHGEDM